MAISDSRGKTRGTHVRSLLCTIALLVTLPVRAATVALLEIHGPDGKLVQFEPDGRFGHCAIRVGHHWLHAHPQVDVELTDDLSRFGRNMQIWTNPHRPDPSPEQVRYYLGLRFNHDFEWTHDGDGTTYCSRLVGELLDIQPLPAFFMGPAVARRISRYGEVGLSPDDIEKIIRTLGFTRVPTSDVGCERAILN